MLADDHLWQLVGRNKNKRMRMHYGVFVHTEEKKFVLFFPYLSTSEKGFWNCGALSKQMAREGQGPEKEGATEKAAGNLEHVVSP